MFRKLLAAGGLALALGAASMLPATAAQAAPRPAQSTTADGETVYLWECVQGNGAGVFGAVGVAPSPTGMWCSGFLPQGHLLPIAQDPVYGWCLPGTRLSYNLGVTVSVTCRPA
ncbi:hypothetical protein [Jidongwangia harbinensis]|uniref:hypothetical protein n=1 Tax=Jidongwangia harbinensis TaxID=2878561 RepID=UPI001CD99E1C|nr:hypothetical protein [Jidongwangia harbinensis]MCA2217201.1 hypothetical protein [Jidongwangia harbinensis]